MTPLLVQGTAQRLPLADASVNCIVTSPPYYGLRSYDALPPEAWPGGAFVAVPGAAALTIPGPEAWKELDACPHVWKPSTTRTAHTTNGTGTSTLQGAHGPWSVALAQTSRIPASGAWCQGCRCWYGTLGSEPTVDLYLWHMVLVLRELSRVLREDGTLWLNLGDSYSASGKSGGGKQGARWIDHGQPHVGPRGGAWHSTEGIPPGNLLGIPWRVALAAQADGWILRRDVVWEKVSPMPESVRGWSFQGEPCPCSDRTNRIGIGPQKTANNRDRHDNFGYHGADIRDRTYGQPQTTCNECHGTGRLDTVTLRRGSWRHTASHEYIFMLVKRMGYWANSEAVREVASAGWKESSFTSPYDEATKRGLGRQPRIEGSGRNPRDVIHPSPSSYSGAHFATFPPSLPEQFLRASCPERVCVACGEPWAVIVSAPSHYPQGSFHDHQGDGILYGKRQNGVGGLSGAQLAAIGGKTTHGLARTCPCPEDTPSRPGVVLDPFGGTATVAHVARALGRASVMIEASPAYLALARERLSLKELDEWLGKPQIPTVVNVTDLPLFSGL